MKEYETVYILQPDLPTDKVGRILDRVKRVLNEGKAEILTEKDWGKKKLSYRIDKHTFGQYQFLNYQGDGHFIGELEKILKYEEGVIRYLTIKTVDDVAKAPKIKRVVQPEDVKFALDDHRPARDERPYTPREKENTPTTGGSDASEI